MQDFGIDKSWIDAGLDIDLRQRDITFSRECFECN